MEDVNMMIHILNNMPKEYEISQAKLEDRLNGNINPLDDEEEEETSLFAGNFKGTCHGCGKQGHKRPDCPENPKNNKFKGRRDFKKRTYNKCAHCGKMHLGKCWLKYGRLENATLKKKRRLF